MTYFSMILYNHNHILLTKFRVPSLNQTLKKVTYEQGPSFRKTFRICRLAF